MILAGTIRAALLFSGVTYYAAAEDQPVRAWAAACATCHGTRGVSGSSIPSLAGRDAEELYRRLLEFKSDKRLGTVMNQHAKGYADSELKQLAEYFSAQSQ